MSTDRIARTELRMALARYMTGEIHSFAFDDVNCECAKSTDASVQQISQFLYNVHDDCVDHSISITPEGWAVLRRILAFLDTDLTISTTAEQTVWPFCDYEQWNANEHRVNETQLPEYDHAVHARHIHPWWRRIPSSIGFTLLALLVIGIFVVVSLL